MILALLRRWLHGLRYTLAGHQALTITDNRLRIPISLQCSCGRVFWCHHAFDGYVCLWCGQPETPEPNSTNDWWHLPGGRHP